MDDTYCTGSSNSNLHCFYWCTCLLRRTRESVHFCHMAYAAKWHDALDWLQFLKQEIGNSLYWTGDLWSERRMRGILIFFNEKSQFFLSTTTDYSKLNLINKCNLIKKKAYFLLPPKVSVIGVAVEAWVFPSSSNSTSIGCLLLWCSLRRANRISTLCSKRVLQVTSIPLFGRRPAIQSSTASLTLNTSQPWEWAPTKWELSSLCVSGDPNCWSSNTWYTRVCVQITLDWYKAISPEVLNYTLSENLTFVLYG